jgi:rubrerythrin
MCRSNYTNQCNAKLKHRSKAQARKVAKRMGNLHTGRLSVYKCPWCGFYHVGKTKNRNGVKSD